MSLCVANQVSGTIFNYFNLFFSKKRNFKNVAKFHLRCYFNKLLEQVSDRLVIDHIMISAVPSSANGLAPSRHPSEMISSSKSLSPAKVSEQAKHCVVSCLACFLYLVFSTSFRCFTDLAPIDYLTHVSHFVATMSVLSSAKRAPNHT